MNSRWLLRYTEIFIIEMLDGCSLRYAKRLHLDVNLKTDRRDVKMLNLKKYRKTVL